jgi:signal transduction histidine kinase/CheY-like chemotaxis protein
MSYEEILWKFIETHPELAARTDCDAWVSARLERYRNFTSPFEQTVLDRAILISDRPTRDGGRVGLRTDISHLKAIESDLRVAKDQAEAANQSKTGFLANMSHEIRTPMTAILGFTDVLLESACSSEQASMLNTIKRNGEHLLSLINDILDLSKIEAGKVEISRERVDVVAICHDVVQSLMWKAREKEITFELDIHDRIPHIIWADPLRIRQIILNLCGNAIKFTDKGVVSLSVQVRTTGPEHQLQIDVRDTGIGMSPEECKRVFQPFEQADDSTTRRFGGTGLGLTISRRLAELLGGTLQVTSNRGEGSLFTFCLPLEIADNIDIPLHQCAASSAGIKPDRLLDRMEILLAEDGLDNQRLIAHVLRKAGATVAIANNGEEVIRAIEARENEGGCFQLVLMDMQMPVRDGYSATREIVQRWPSLPVAAITAHTMSTDREACLQAGCCAYLSKPIDRKELIATCADLGNVT